jgi:hypothetical protein
VLSQDRLPAKTVINGSSEKDDETFNKRRTIQFKGRYSMYHTIFNEFMKFSFQTDKKIPKVALK